MQDLLAQLKDIHIEQNIAWQLAWGWWVLLVLAIIVVLILLVFLIKIWRLKRLKNSVKRSLEAALNKRNPAIECLLILRSYADFRHPKIDIKTFNQKQWQDFLAEKLLPSEQLKLLFSVTMYQPAADIDKQQLLDYCQKWVDCV